MARSTADGGWAVYAPIYKEIVLSQHANPEAGGLLWQSGPPKRSRFSAALNGISPNLLLRWMPRYCHRDRQQIPRPCEIEHRRKLEEISHGKHC